MSFIKMSSSYDLNAAKYTSTVSVKGEAEGYYCYLYRVAKDSLFNSASLVMEGMAPFDYTVEDKNTLAVDSYAYIVTKVKYDPALITLIIPPNFWYYMNNTSGSRLSGTVCNAGFLPGDSVTVYSYTECNSSSDSCHHTTGAWYGIDGVITGGNTYHNHSGSHSETFTVPDDGVDHVIKYSYNDSQPSWDSMTLLKQNKGFNPFKDDLGPLWKVENGILKPNIDTTELEALRAQVASLTNQLNTANQTIISKNVEIEQLKAQIATLSSQLNAANQTISSKNAEIEQLKAQIVSLNEQVTQLTADKNNLQSELNTANQTIIEKDAIIEQLKAEIDNINSGSDNVYVELNIAKEKIKELELAKSELEKNINNLNNTIDGLNNTIDSLNNTIIDKDNNIEALNLKIINLNKSISDLQSQITILNKDKSDLQREIDLLKSQIDNSGSSNSDLLEKLNIAERELDKLNNEVLQRLQQIESKLDGTSQTVTINKQDIEEMKSSLIKDITAALGTPRFGMVPLPIAKQAIATSGELLSDPGTGHVYFKNGKKIVSKTIEMEDKITDLYNYNESTWVAISINSDNYDQFISSNNIFANSDKTISTSNNIIEMDKIKIYYDPLTMYTISARANIGKITKAYFKDENGNKYNCILNKTSGNDFVFYLNDKNIGNVIIYPVIEVSTNTTIVSMLIYKSLVNDIQESSGDNFGGTDIDESLIDDNTIINNDKSYTVNISHPIRVTIPTDALRSGLYSLILRVRGNNINKIMAKTVFNGIINSSDTVDFSKIELLANGKSAYIDVKIPVITGIPNYIEISVIDNIECILDYFVISMINFDKNLYYTKSEINAKDIPTGKTSNSGNSYTLNTNLVSEYYDGLLCKIKINNDSNGECLFRCNNLSYKKIVDANGNPVKKLKSGIWYHVCFNAEDGNFILLGKGGGGDAQPNHVLLNKIFTNDDGEQVGTMRNNPVTNKKINCGVRVAINEGFHPEGFIESNTLSSQTQGNATKDVILKGYRAWVNGELVDGGLDIKMGSSMFYDLFSTRHWGTPEYVTEHTEIYSDTPDDNGRHHTVYFKDYSNNANNWEYEYNSDKYWSDLEIIRDNFTGKFYIAGYRTYLGAYGYIYEIDMVNHTIENNIWRTTDNHKIESYICNNGLIVVYSPPRSSETDDHRLYFNNSYVKIGLNEVNKFTNGRNTIVYGAGVNKLYKINVNGVMKQVETGITAFHIDFNTNDNCIYLNGDGQILKFDEDLNLIYRKTININGKFIIDRNYLIFSGSGIIVCHKDTGVLLNNTNYSWSGTDLYIDYLTNKPIVGVRVSASGADYRYYKNLVIV